VIELLAERIVAGGAALAHDDQGRVVFIDGALPGERVSVEITEQRKDFGRARLIEVVDRAADRVTPPCKFVALGCGGCGWQHIEPQAQRALKRGIVIDALRRIAHLEDANVVDGPPLSATGYRTTVRVAVVDGRAAFHIGASHRLIAVDACLVTHPLLDQLLREGRFDGATEVVLRAGVVTGERLAWPRPESAGLRLPADVAVGERVSVHEVVAGHRFRISARSFFQTRPDGAEALVHAVTDAAGPLAASDGHLVDAYSGVGLYAATLGAHRPVTAIELDRHALADARTNLAHLAATLVRGEVARWRAEPAELVVADPARPGLGSAAASALAAAGAARFVLVSCDAASFGRDTRLLDELGYTHEKSTVIDLFPHTPHVEVVSAFVRR
jgi:23S rRNA (uracil1939-C5)-methyltransferase